MRRSNGRDFLRNPFGWIAFFFFLLAALPAVSDTVVLGSTVYVFSPGQMPAEPTYTLAVQGVSLHPETLEPVVQPCVAGAVFGIYARSGGDFVPFPDFADPSRPLLLVSQPTPLAVFLPRSTDLYIKQESAPAGYVIGEHEGEYLPLTQPGDLTFTNLWSGMQALRVTFTGNGANGAVPLAGVRFHLIGRGQTIPLETDEAGVALALASEPGEYTLAQAEPPDGYRMEPPVTVLLSPGAVTDVSVSNNQNGFLSLRTLGMAVDGQKLTRLVAIDRRYEVLDGNGVACGTLSSGETLALPASPEGIRYTLRPAGIAEDGFAPDTETNEFSVYPGQTTEYQTIAASEMGFFTLSHVSGDDGASVPGGAFAVLDSRGDTVLAFEADSNGAYTPPAPLKAGHYVLTMTRAGEGHLYDGHIAPFTISPYLAADSPIAEVTYVSQPLPAGLLSPQITAMSQACNSLFLSDAEVDFTLTLTQNWRDLPIKGLTFDLHAPEIAGAAWLGERPDGGRLYIPRRFALAGVEEVHALSVSGIARYSFEYPVAPDTLAQKNITAPFDVTVATFTPLASPAAYAVSGHVTDAAGKSLSGLPVTLEDESGAPLAQTVTDPYGAYAFSYKPDGAVVRFHPADGYGALPNGQDARILPLETVQGHVLVHGPLDGYPVTLSIAGLDPQAPDRDGRFVFTGMLLSKEALSVQTPEGVLWRIEGGPPESIIHLYPAASLLGRALDPQGKPIAGAEIVLTGAERTYAAYSRGDGSYQIGELYPGAYEIAFTPPKGLILNGEHMQTIELLAGERRTLDVRMMEPGVIEGMITADNAPLVGVPVLLEPVGLAVITDERGRFTLTPLSADTYTLGVALPEGMVFIEPPEPVTLSQSGERVSFDLAAVYPVTLTGLVWHDLNDDGLRSTDEPGLEGITVTLLSTEQTPAAAAQTGQNGTYTFTDLLPGTYRIGVALPENMIFAKSAPEVTRLLAGIDSNTAISGPITLRSGDRPDLLVCGGTHTARLSGFVWEDVSVTGAYREGTDPLLAGIAVTLIKEGAVRRETLTDEKGAYAFAGLRTGEYTLRMTLPDGYLFAENSYAEGTKSDMPAILGRTAEREVSLAAWQAEAAVNAGVMKAAALSGLVWIDTEADGTQWNSKGYSGLAISLYALSGARETLVAERETDETGAYAFEGLRPGQYRLAYRLPEAGWGFTVGSASEVFSLGNGERLETKAAVSKLGCICGLVFADTNYDGYRGEEDPGLTATVSLVDPFTGTILRQAQAGKDGAYAFDSLF
ncbi:MAG: carboxypeptidase regulatory-like domain-containing protein, partial [Firmicutes bacterium]|nr:carboxypeptidase regulatory-like domain-containing protein [Bacillota bacterium]